MENRIDGSPWVWKGKRYFLLLVVPMKLPVIISATAVLCTLAGGMYARWRQMMFQLEDRYGKEKAEQLPEYREFERQREEALRDLQR